MSISFSTRIRLSVQVVIVVVFFFVIFTQSNEVTSNSQLLEDSFRRCDSTINLVVNSSQNVVMKKIIIPFWIGVLTAADHLILHIISLFSYNIGKTVLIETSHWVLEHWCHLSLSLAHTRLSHSLSHLLPHSKFGPKVLFTITKGCVLCLLHSTHTQTNKDSKKNSAVHGTMTHDPWTVYTSTDIRIMATQQWDFLFGIHTR